MKVRGNSSGEPVAPSIDTIYELHRPRVLGFFMSKGLQRDAAEDLTQEVFFRLLRSRKALVDEEYTRNLIFRIAGNLAIDHFRKTNGPVQEKAGAEDDLAERGHPLLVCPTSPEDVFISAETSCDVKAVLSHLPDRHARAIVLRELHGMSYREMAETMGISEKAAESLLHRARVQLKSGLAEAGERRGGWWSAIPMLPGAFTRSMARRVSSLTRAAFRKAAGLSTGTGALGLGYSALNIVVVVLLVGSLVCMGVVTAVSGGERAPTGRWAGGVPAMEQGPAAATERTVDDEGEDYIRRSPETESRTPGANEAGLVRDLLARPGGAARGLLENTGDVLDATVAQLGGLMGTLTDPLFMILSPMGLPPGVASALQGVRSLAAARQMAAALVETGVDGTYAIDSVTGMLMLSGTNSDAAATAASATPASVREPGQVQQYVNAGDQDGVQTPGGVPAGAQQQPQQPTTDTRPDAPSDQQQGNPVTDLVEFLKDALLPF